MPEDASPRGSRALVVGLALLGLALRVGAAIGGSSSASVREWEADGFQRSWEALPWLPLVQNRPPLMGWLQHALASLLGLQSVPGVRLLAVAFSVAALGGALLLARTIQSVAGNGDVRARARTAAWVTGLWALWPTLVVSAPSPTADALLGAVLCGLAAAAVSLAARPGVRATLVLAALAVVALLLGGVPVVLALVAGLLAFLLPLPPARVALPCVLAVALATGLAWWWQRDADGARGWRPEAAPAYALAALLDVPIPVDSREPVDAAVRSQKVYALALAGAQEAGPIAVAGRGAQRLSGELLGPVRFAALGAGRWPVGLLDVALLGACLALAVTTLCLTKPAAGSESPPGARACFPRAGLLAGGAVLLLALVAGATHPFALAPLAAPLLGLAGPALAGASPALRRARGPACAAGALLLAVVAAGPALREQPLSPWLDHLDHGLDQGVRLVAALADGGPHTFHDEVFAAEAMLDHGAPFLRCPEGARRHALRAVQSDPENVRAVTQLIVAEVDNLDFDAASDLAATLLDPSGLPTPDGRVLAAWVRDQERRLQLERLP